MTRKKTTHNSTKGKSLGLINLPYSKNFTTKVEKIFLSLIDKHFPPHYKLHKLINWNNIKISYCCLPNIKSVINTLNRNTLYTSPTIGRRTSNCISIPQCPLQHRCLNKNISYQASITSIGENSETKVYYGICKTIFKIRKSQKIVQLQKLQVRYWAI